MVAVPKKQILPSTADLPCSDDTPVDNEDQNLLPNLLLILLTHLWSDRMDWYFGVDMAVYHTTGPSPYVPVVPDGFLSLGVERKKNGKSRKSYAVWEEQEIVPTMVLEMVSHKPGGEYDRKIETYTKLGVLYYVIYNPEFWQRDRHQPFEVYKLVSGKYQLQIGEPYWMPEVGLGIGRVQKEFGGLPQEMLTWYDESGQPHLSAAEQAQFEAEQAQLEVEQAQFKAEQAQLKAESALRKQAQLEAFLKAQGFDPDNLT